MKHLGLLFSLIVIASLLAACATPTPEVVKEVVKETVIVEGTPQVVEKVVTATPEPKGGKIVVAIGAEPDMLYPQRGSSSWAGLINATLYDTLVYIGPDGNFQPGLAESWEYADDAMTYTFHLRKDVKFHDGTPFNAEAVRFSFERVMDPEARAWAAYAYMEAEKLDSVEVLDEYTVRVNYKEPFAPFMTAITTMWLAPVSPPAVEKWGEDFGRNPVGTGPFKFVEWVSGSHVTVERNPDYKWAPPFIENKGPAYLEQITFRFITDNQTRLAALETGEADIIESVPAPEVPRFWSDPGYQILKHIPAGNGMILQINHDKWPGSMMEVRQAMNYAVNQVAINNILYTGLYDPAYGPVSPTTPCYWKGVEDLYPHDLDKAKQILADAGFKDTDGDGIVEMDGKPLAIDFYWNAGLTGWTQLAEAVQAQMRQAGIDLVLYGLERDAYFSAVHDAKQGMNFMWYERDDPDILRILFHSKGAVEGGFNRAYYRNAEVDVYLDKGAQTGDLEQRCESYYKAQEQIMKDAAIVPVNNRVVFWGAKSSLKDLVMPKQVPFYHDAYIEK